MVLLSQKIMHMRQKFAALLEQAARVGLKSLGSLITTTGSTEEDVEARCRIAQVTFSILGPIWRSKFMSLWTKIRIFNSNVKSALLYGSETWRLTKKIITRLQTFTNRRVWYILGV